MRVEAGSRGQVFVGHGVRCHSDKSQCVWRRTAAVRMQSRDDGADALRVAMRMEAGGRGQIGLSPRKRFVAMGHNVCGGGRPWSA